MSTPGVGGGGVWRREMQNKKHPSAVHSPYMPTPKLGFQEQKSPKSRTQHNFRNTSANLPDFYRKITGQSTLCTSLADSAHLRTLPITLDYMPVQSFHNSSANFRVQTSGTFLTNDDERPLLMVYFLKRFETSPFHWRRF